MMRSVDPLVQLRDFFACEHVVPVGSGTVGIRLALETIGAAGRTVIMPAVSCANVGVAILAAGARPLLVDVSPATACLDPGQVREAMREDVAAVIAINAFGKPADMAALRAAAPGAVLIDDACQGYGGHADGGAVGNRGDIGVVSFGYAKHIDLRGGGLLLLSDGYRDAVRGGMASHGLIAGVKNSISLRLMLKDRYQRMVDWHRFGLLSYAFPPRQWAGLHDRWAGYVSRLGEVRSALHGELAAALNAPGVEPFGYTGDGWVPWRYSVLARSAETRDAIAARWRDAGVRVSTLYPPVTDFLTVESAGDLPVARDLMRRLINIVHGYEPGSIVRDARVLARVNRPGVAS